MIFETLGLLFMLAVIYLTFRFVRGKHEAIVDRGEPSIERVALDRQAIATMPPITVEKITVIGRG